MIAGAAAAGRRSRVGREPLGPALWTSVLLLAAVLAYADGFWLIALQNAVGAIERTPEPVADWLRWSTPMLPVYGLAVLGALLLARRGRGSTSSSRRLLRGALLVTGAATVVGIGALAASAAYDYRLQSQALDSDAATHAAAGGHVHDGCDPLCLDKRATLVLDARAVALGGLVELGTNAVLVGWITALRGGRLDARPPRPGGSTAGPVPRAVLP